MSQSPSPFKLSMNTQNPFAKPVRAAMPSFAAAPITTKANATTQRYNPFMLAMNSDSPEFKTIYGINKPLEKPMFVGYHDNKPIYGGNRLFILY